MRVDQFNNGRWEDDDYIVVLQGKSQKNKLVEAVIPKKIHECMVFIMQHKPDQESPYVFSKNGERMNSGSTLKKVAQSVNLGPQFQGTNLRHMLATLASDMPRSTQTLVQKHMGHSRAVHESTYVSPLKTTKKKVLHKLLKDVSEGKKTQREFLNNHNESEVLASYLPEAESDEESDRPLENFIQVATLISSQKSKVVDTGNGEEISSYDIVKGVLNHSIISTNVTSPPNTSTPENLQIDYLDISGNTPNSKQTQTTNISPILQTSSGCLESSPSRDDSKPKLSRKRKRNPETWKRNVRKNLKNQGNAYVTQAKKIKLAKNVPRPINCDKCRKRCTQNVLEEERILINSAYWEMGDYTRQCEFICRFVEVKSTQNSKTSDTSIESDEKKRKFVYHYFLPKSGGNNLQKIPVCKPFFLSTLNIGEKTVKHAKEKEKMNSTIINEDKRGKKTPPNKTPETEIMVVKNHINLFPRVPSHYCRASSQREYLDCDLNVNKMYQLYVKHCEMHSYAPVKINMYRKIFNEDFNLSFHHPKKDSCKTCEKFLNIMNEEEKKNFKTTYNKHIMNKNKAREMKNNDKILAQKDESVKVYTFDLQSVLNSPQSTVSNFYYSRKFATYNLTIFDLATKDGFCYVWNENDGMRGSDEIGTALWTHLQSLPPHVKNVIFYSDCCGGQNRNRYIATLMQYAAKTLHFDSVEMKYLESGHTQMEVDSMHSTIEFAKKKLTIYTPLDYPTIFRMARRKQPYVVKELSYQDFYDLKKLKNSINSGNMDKDITGEKINWNDVKWLKFLKSNFLTILIKDDYSDAPFLALHSILPKNNKKNRLTLSKKFSKCIPISKEKKKDLIELCEQMLIPKQYHDFYKQLTVTENNE